MKKQLVLAGILLICIQALSSESLADTQFVQIYEYVATLPSNTALAYWIEDTGGQYISTVYVTNKVAKQGIGILRPSILPVWAGRRSDEWGMGYPTTENPLPDTVTSATPPAGTFLREWNVPSSLDPGNYYYFVEVNLPWNTNEFYTNSTLGQPSVVFRGSLKVDTESVGTEGVVVGHGHPTGANGTLIATIDSLTTALTIITGLAVNHYIAPLITATSLADAAVGQEYRAEITFVDPNTNDSHSFSLLAGPDWMSINSAGIIGGIPGQDDAGNGIPVTVRIADSSDMADTLSTTIDVLKTNAPPEIMTAAIPDAVAGSQYITIIRAVDPDPDDLLAYMIVNGPDWLTVDPASGVLSGLPGAEDIADNIPVTVRVTDSGGLEDEAAFQFNVVESSTLPVLLTVDGQGGHFDAGTIPELENIGLGDLNIDVPAGAVGRQEVIRIEIPAIIPDMGSVLQAVDFTVDGYDGRYDFILPVTISIPFSGEIADGEPLAIREWDPLDHEWNTIELSSSIIVDYEMKVVAAEVAHFSIYGVVKEESSISVSDAPAVIALRPPFPNPSNSITTFQFELSGEFPVRLSVYDILGREIALLADERFSTGIHTRSWDGMDADGNAIGNGVYFYLFRAGNYARNGKLLLLK